MKKMLRKMSLKAKLIISTGLLLAILVLITTFMVRASLLNLLEATVSHNVETTVISVEGFIQQKTEQALAISATAAARPDVAQAAKVGDRDVAMEMLGPIFADVRERFDVTVLHFMARQPGDLLRGFARTQRPQNEGGDEVTSNVILATANSGVARTGFRQAAYGMGMRGWVPVFADNQVVGVMETNIAFTEELLNEIEEGLAGATLAVFAPERGEFILQSGRAELQPPPHVFEQARQGASEVVRENNTAYSLFPIRDYDDNLLAVVGVFQDVSAHTAMVNNQLRQLLLVIVSLGLVVVIAVFFLISSATRPIAQTVQMIKEMGQGRLDRRLNMQREDEIGQMAAAMDEFADTLQHQVVGSLQKLAQGDLTFEVKPYDDQDLIGTALLKTNRDLNRIVGEITAATDQIAAGSSQVAGSSQSLSQGATESAASLEQITSSMTEMASQTKRNAENSTQANQLAGEARQVAETGNEQMEKMMAAMTEINQAGQNISKIIKVIDEIAFQTNLLALNAAVEAARAGRHGKGFAVVAEEVRNLAARSAKAAKETAELIEGSVAKTANGTEIASQTAESLKEIVTAITKATDLVGEIAAASNEQAQGIAQVNQGLSQIDQVTQTNTANAEEGAAAAEELSSQGDYLRELISTFTIKESPVGGRRRALPVGHETRFAETGEGAFGGWDSLEAESKGEGKRKSREAKALEDREFDRF
ncbi:methyl-accepting chemotaxis protein [Desulfurivibrio alkaliphilus]|uniref:Methyl-accepting chemotaxis sensory transducer n=1 Tax=Desulfurivibrio alkaliphilus (strain DSM 19089 / UNIQEM U267 / AHT2) TaxID=589865 RepID=D6Z1A5_DESAT|nr:methyl-accepting chemotaxis protein [Desulfurivibrio alkaliphilus]ADH85360.1 methyl-accepting chemotaxis sensory transducer [Desulfurivibrio alkaliphilus AHT 2]